MQSAKWAGAWHWLKQWHSVSLTKLHPTLLNHTNKSYIQLLCLTLYVICQKGGLVYWRKMLVKLNPRHHGEETEKDRKEGKAVKT